jgi:hypothetical protein
MSKQVLDRNVLSGGVFSTEGHNIWSIPKREVSDDEQDSYSVLRSDDEESKVNSHEEDLSWGPFRNSEKSERSEGLLYERRNKGEFPRGSGDVCYSYKHRQYGKCCENKPCNGDIRRKPQSMAFNTSDSGVTATVPICPDRIDIRISFGGTDRLRKDPHCKLD